MALTFVDRHPIQLAATGIAHSLAPAVDPVTNAPSMDPLEVHRAPDSAGAPGSFALLTTLPPLDAAGTPFVDPLPLTTARYWYKFRHIRGAGLGTFSIPVGPFEAVEIVDRSALLAASISYDPAWIQQNARIGTHTQQLLPNSGFEDDGLPWWAVFGTGTLALVSNSANARSGNRYATITSSTGATATAMPADDRGQPRYFEVNPNDVIQFGGWLYRESGTANVRFTLELTDKDKSNALYVTSANQNTAAWVQVQAQEIVGAGKKYARIYAEVDSTGTATVARVDDVFLRIAFGASTVLNYQGSVTPTPSDASAGVNFQWFTNAGNGGSTRWVALNLPGAGKKIYRPDGATVNVASRAQLPAPTLSQVAGGALAARTRWVMVFLMKDGFFYAGDLGGGAQNESSIAIGANNLLKVMSPAAVAGFDGWAVMVGETSGTECSQAGNEFTAMAFGVDWTEPVGGAAINGRVIYSANWNTQGTGGIITLPAASSTTLNWYLAYDQTIGAVRALNPNGNGVIYAQTTRSATLAQAQNGDNMLALSYQPVTTTTPADGNATSGTPLAVTNDSARLYL